MKAITLSQYASALDVTYRTCLNWIKSGRLRNVEKVGRHRIVYIDESFPSYADLQEFVNIDRQKSRISDVGHVASKNAKVCVICSDQHSGSGHTCSMRCRQSLIKLKFIEKYGVDNPAKSADVQKRAKENCLKKHGVEHHFMLNATKEKIKNTCNDRYGVENYAQSAECHESIKMTSKMRYGVSHFSQSSLVKKKIEETNIKRYDSKCSLGNAEIKEKSIKTCQERYGSDTPFASPSIKEKIASTNLQRYGVRCIFQTGKCKAAAISKSARDKRSQTLRDKKSSKISAVEDLVFESLTQIFHDVERQVPVESWEIDFYIRDIDTFLNFNGVYWHGKSRTREDLESSKNKQDKKILETKLRDEKRLLYFKQKHMNFAVLWEDDFLRDGQEAIAHALGWAGIVRWKRLGIYEFPDLHPGKLFDILSQVAELPQDDTGEILLRG